MRFGVPELSSFAFVPQLPVSPSLSVTHLMPGAYPQSFLALAPQDPQPLPPAPSKPARRPMRGRQEPPREKHPNAFFAFVEKHLPDIDDEDDSPVKPARRARNHHGFDSRKQRDRVRVERRESNRRVLSGSFVYVGNLDRFVNDALLREHFACAGTVTAITIRSSGGGVHNWQVPPTDEDEVNDRVYATVEFTSPRSAQKAIELCHNTLLHDRTYRIIVSASPWDLPEGKLARAAAMQPPAPGPSSGRARPVRRHGSRDCAVSSRRPGPYERLYADEPGPSSGRASSRTMQQKLAREKAVSKARVLRLMGGAHVELPITLS